MIVVVYNFFITIVCYMKIPILICIQSGCTDVVIHRSSCPYQMIIKINVFLSWKCTYSCSFSGGNLDFKLQEWGQIKIQKIQRASNRTQKNSRTKLSSPKNPMPNFWALKICRKENKFGFWLNFNLRTVRPGYTGTTTNLQIVLNSQEIPT